jgi:hypothetical protein
MAAGLDDREVQVRVLVGARLFSSPRRSDWYWGARTFFPKSTEDPFLVIKRPEREAEYSTPTTAEVKYTWIYISTPDRLCGLVVKVPGYRSRGPDLILGAWN